MTGRPAARLGDSTAHGTALTGSGSPNVLIGGKPAWRALTDFHTCPLTSGTAPHVGGVVTEGSPSVFVNGVPAARLGDTIAESGPSNKVTTGCPSVTIG